MALIAVLAGAMFGVSRVLVRRAGLEGTHSLIDRIGAVLDAYWDQFGVYPGDIGLDPTAADANIAVAGLLVEAGAVADEAEVVSIGGRPHVQDFWGRDIYIIRDGFNSPDLDIWSRGPNGDDDSGDHSIPANRYNYGDDLVNWAKRK